MVECYNHNCIITYLKERDFKFNNQINLLSKQFIFPYYYNSWLSGFIEAEGCFSLRKNNNHSFSIGQKTDKYLLESIKLYFDAKNMIREIKAIDRSNILKYPRELLDFYLLEIYRKETLFKIIDHFNKFPLLGNKNDSFIKFCLEIKKL